MRTLHLGLRAADPERSLGFYRALGYEVIGSVPNTPIGHLTMLKLPDDPFVALELVHDPSRTPDGVGGGGGGGGLSHVVVQVESLDATIARLAAHGIEADPPEVPEGSDDVRVTLIYDPDGNRIELLQWPAGHPTGMTAADWP